MKHTDNTEEQIEASREYRYGRNKNLSRKRDKPEFIIESYEPNSDKEVIEHQFLCSCWSAARHIIDTELSKGNWLKVFTKNHY